MQNYNFVKNDVFVAKICKYPLYESSGGLFCAPRKAANFCHPALFHFWYSATITNYSVLIRCRSGLARSYINFCVKKGRNCGGFLQKCFTPVAWGAMLCHVMPFSPFFRLVGKCFIFWSSPTLWGYFEGCGWFGESGTVQENWDFDPSSLNSAQGWQHCQMMSWKDPSVPKTFHTNMRYSTSIAHL